MKDLYVNLVCQQKDIKAFHRIPGAWMSRDSARASSDSPS